MAKVYTAAGHGGVDPGAVDGKGAGDALYTEEEDIALDVTLRLNAALVRCGISVKTRRTGDTANPDKSKELAARAAEANAWGATIYVEPHFNSGASTARGIETLYWHTSTKGKDLAQKVQTQLETCSPWADRGIKPRDNLYVLRATAMPAIIPEYGFISNTTEEQLVNDPAYRQRLAEATAKGICAYLKVPYKAPTAPAPAPAPAPPTPVPTPVPPAGWQVSSQNSNTIVLTKVG
jgi:N-acetylmuramoyl-L-alanine amidase